MARGHGQCALIVSYRARLLDRDNFVGGCKAVVDSLRTSGYIVDDAHDLFQGFYIQRKCATVDERTDIYIFNLSEINTTIDRVSTGAGEVAGSSAPKQSGAGEAGSPQQGADRPGVGTN